MKHTFAIVNLVAARVASGAGCVLAAVPGSDQVAQPAGHPAKAGWGGGRGLCMGCDGAQLGHGVLDHGAQGLGFKGAGAEIGGDGEAGLGSAAMQLLALRLAHADGDAGVFQISIEGRGLEEAGFMGAS